MKALSIHQPWAGLIAHGVKTIEIRKWGTEYRGPLVICSTKAPPVSREASLRTSGFWGDLAPFPALCDLRGHALAVVNLRKINWVGPAHHQAQGQALCHVHIGAMGWYLEDVRLIEPVPVRGRQGLWALDDTLIQPEGLWALDDTLIQPVRF